MNASDTIAAISCAAGAAARMVVRVDGPDAPRVAAELTRLPVEDIRGGTAWRTTLQFSGLRLPAWLYVFRSPRSYTGGDLVEFHVPGNPLIARMLLDALRAAGARAAEPGEFTARAFFNGRLDLTEAEGVAATIAAGNEQELAAARQLLAGELARRLRPAMELITDTLALVEAGIDFSDEGVTFLSGHEIGARVERADDVLRQLLDESTRFERLAHEPTAVLVGRPNAGKSTLLNALAGRERAVTSPVAGTTRDALSEEAVLPRGVIRLIDVAGLAAAGGFDTAEPINSQMRDRALRAMQTADLVLLVQEVTDPAPPVAAGRQPDLIVRTKSDLVDLPLPGAKDEVLVSALTGHGLDELRNALDRLAFGGSQVAGSALALNARHVEAVQDARRALCLAADRVHDPSPELLAVELRDALDAAGRVLGSVTPNELLGRIFSTFCIGK
jgi:tRNA modification GTPase